MAQVFGSQAIDADRCDVSSPQPRPYPLISGRSLGDGLAGRGRPVRGPRRPSRARILHLLAISERELCVCDMALVFDERLSVVPSAARPAERGAVSRRKAGRIAYYRLDRRPPSAVVLDAAVHVAEGRHLMPHAQSPAAGHRNRLIGVFVLTLSIFVIEVVGALLSNSLALLADAGHVFTDVFGVGFALTAIWLAGRPATSERSFGFLRLEIFAAVANAILLFGVAAYILYEAWRRLSEPPEVASGADARGRRRRADRQWRLHLPAALRPEPQPEHARRLPGGRGRSPWDPLSSSRPQ